ncbi:hypothetical protein ACOME3_007155 [Neoechinorhynchus agilis]
MAIKRARRGQRGRKKPLLRSRASAVDVVDLIQSKTTEQSSSSSEESDSSEEGNVCDDQYDMSVYKLLLRAQTGYPCLSFDFVPHSKPPIDSSNERLCVTLVAGTQSDMDDRNSLVVARMSDMRFRSDDETDRSDVNRPRFDQVTIGHDGCTNRLRCCRPGSSAGPLSAEFVATWSDSGQSTVNSTTSESCTFIASFFYFTPSKLALNIECLNFTSTSPHNCEGYALDWSNLSVGYLLAGNCNGLIRLIRPDESGFLEACDLIFKGGSIEDLQWSPMSIDGLSESVFIACSTDGSLLAYDVRDPSRYQLRVSRAHSSDVNVVTWNRLGEPFLVSGGDDGLLKLWDLRALTSSQSFGVFNYHKKPITSVEWHAHESSIFAASSEDDQLSIWDLAVENAVENGGGMEDNGILPQLIFNHAGQKSIKEVHWHEQISGLLVSTALSGFDVIKTINA